MLATRGNLNNDIGLPLTLLGLRHAHRWCAIELGMNHKGEIAYLAGIARPTVALVNNAQREHLEFMRSVEEVAAENASVYDALPADGVAVINADDAHADFFRSRAGKRRTLDFGLERGAVTGRYALARPVERAAPAHARRARPMRRSRSPACTTCATRSPRRLARSPWAFRCKTIGEGLSAFRPYTGRLQVKQATSGATVIDDSYNANPDSVRAAIDVLAASPGADGAGARRHGRGRRARRRVPPRGRRLRARQGRRRSCSRWARRRAHAVEAFGEGARHFDQRRRAGVARSKRSTVLVKGSRFMKMERVVAALTGTTEGGH